MKLNNRLLLIGLLVSIFFLFQCGKEKIEAKDLPQEFITIEYDAQDFLELIKESKASLTGLIVKINSQGLVFEKLYFEQEKYTSELIDEPLDFEIFSIDPAGNLQSASNMEFSKKKLQFWNGTFDLALFPSSMIELIASNSEKIYFSGVNSTLGNSIHSKHPSNTRDDYFSLKLEGDFKNVIDLQRSSTDAPIPMTIYGLPCPPYWMSGEGGG